MAPLIAPGSTSSFISVKTLANGLTKTTSLFLTEVIYFSNIYANSLKSYFFSYKKELNPAPPAYPKASLSLSKAKSQTWMAAL